MTIETLNFEDFKKLALRTESKVDSAQIDSTEFMTLLEIFISVGTLLDYTKKGIFYNNYSKHDDNFESLLKDLERSISMLRLNVHEKPTGHKRETHSALNFRLIHGLLGAMTESAEIGEHLLKYLRTGEIDKAGIGEEFSDSDWYKAITYDELELEEPVTRQNVIDKLRVRFPDKYNDDDAANRRLDQERKELEKNI